MLRSAKEHSEVYDDKDEYEDELPESKGREGYRGRGRYGY